MNERKQLAAKYATDFERIAAEFDRMLAQCQKSKHLLIQSSRTAAKAGRLLAKAIDDGVLPPRFANLSGCAKLNTNPQSDGNAMGFFGMFGTVFLKTAYPEKFNANAGAFALSPKPKTDENGKLLGRDGKPVTWVVTGEWGKPGYSARLSDEVATVADDYDEQDGLEHLRARTTDYADTCRALAESFRIDEFAYPAKIDSNSLDLAQPHSNVTAADAPTPLRTDEGTMTAIFPLRGGYYLGVSPTWPRRPSVDSVFYSTNNEVVARLLCNLFAKEFGPFAARRVAVFDNAELTPDIKARLDDSLNAIDLQEDQVSDRKRELTERAYLARQAATWENMMEARPASVPKNQIGASTNDGLQQVTPIAQFRNIEKGKEPNAADRISVLLEVLAELRMAAGELLYIAGKTDLYPEIQVKTYYTALKIATPMINGISKYLEYGRDDAGRFETRLREYLHNLNQTMEPVVSDWNDRPGGYPLNTEVTKPAWDLFNEARAIEVVLKLTTLKPENFQPSFDQPLNSGHTSDVDRATRPEEKTKANDKVSQRADGFYPPRTVVWQGKPHDCDLTKREMAFLNIGLRSNEIDIHELMHTNNGIVWKERYLHTKKKRNKISQFLKRLNERLVDAKPPVNLFFSLRRESDSISRTEGTMRPPQSLTVR